MNRTATKTAAPTTDAVPGSVRIDHSPLGRVAFGLTAVFLLVLVWTWPARGTGLWGPGVSTALAWSFYVAHVFLVRRHVHAFDPVIWLPALILLYHTGVAISIEFFGSTVHDYDALDLGWGPPRLNQTYGVICLTLVSFLFGIHLAGLRDARRPIETPPPKSMMGPGLCLLIGGLAMSVVGIFIFGPSLLFGSYAAHRVAATLGQADFRLYGTGNLFIQAGVFAVVASYDKRRPFPLYLAAFAALYYSAVLLGTGYRGHLSAFAFGTGYVICSRVARLPHLLVIGLFTTMLLLIPIMREFREHRTVEQTSDYRSLGDFTAQAFYEMGTATHPLAVTIDTIPYKKPYDWGLSAVAAMLSNIPNFGTSVAGWWFTLDPYEHLPSVWFTAYVKPTRFYRRGGGFAFAMAAEWYWNFGFPGVFLGMTWMGWMVTWLRNKGAQSAFLMATTSLFIAMMCINIRNAMGFPSRMFLWPFIGFVVMRGLWSVLAPEPERARADPGGRLEGQLDPEARQRRAGT